jgi:hypothetical protein
MNTQSQESRVLSAAETMAKANGISEEQAEGYLSAIGDNPETDESGKVIVRDRDGKEVARLLYPSPKR